MRHYRILFSLFIIPFFAAFALENIEIAKPIPQLLPQQTHRLHPILTTVAIIEIYEGGHFQGIVLIKRGKAPLGIALPGGHVEWGETCEQAVRREMLEETHLELDQLRQFHVYSDPLRDKRQHSIELTYLAKATGTPKAGDDAKEAFVTKLEEIPWRELCFNHRQILKDYIAYRYGGNSQLIVIP